MQTTNCESLVAFPLDEITSFDLSVSPGGVHTQYQTVMETLSSGQLKISGASFSTTQVMLEYLFIYLDAFLFFLQMFGSMLHTPTENDQILINDMSLCASCR